jgi:hypothetical protein
MTIKQVQDEEQDIMAYKEAIPLTLNLPAVEKPRKPKPGQPADGHHWAGGSEGTGWDV